MVLVKRYGMETLLDGLERNEDRGVADHREGLVGDDDGFSDAEALIKLIKEGKRSL